MLCQCLGVFVFLSTGFLWPLTESFAEQETITSATPEPHRASLPRLKQFFITHKPLCETGPAIECTREVVRHFDHNGDEHIEREEIADLETLLNDFANTEREVLSPADLQYLRVGALVMKLVGPRGVISLFDEDDDSAVTTEELLSGLDDTQRPWPVIAAKPDFITELKAFSRLGILKIYLDQVLP